VREGACAVVGSTRDYPRTAEIVIDS